MIQEKKTYYCLFEQSGTFKDVFIKLGYNAYDFDIQNEYEKTDYICNLFDPEVIQNIIYCAKEDNATLLMFFPCTYFSDQQILWTRGVNNSQKKWTLSEKIDKSIFNIQKVAEYYSILCLWIDLCVKENISLIIENPYSPNSFLIRYLPIKPSIIDYDRRRLGDKFEKPTMWYFINKEVNDNFELLNTFAYSKQSKVQHTKYGKERSEISSTYALNFIKTFILCTLDFENVQLRMNY